MREFSVITKKLVLNIEGKSYSFRCPSIGESESLSEEMAARPGESVKIYKAFFVNLGLPGEAFDKLPSADFVDFVKYVLAPNESGSLPTA
jgi:hypothetical protein